MSDDNRYLSKYTGEEIDEAVEKITHLDKVSDSITIESSPDNKFNVNDMLEMRNGNYQVSYFTGTADDSSTVRPITIRIRHLDSTTIEQRYEEKPGVVYYRTYNTLTGEFTPWTQSKTIVSIACGETLGVRETALVFRHVSEYAYQYMKCRKYDGAQKLAVSTTPT